MATGGWVTGSEETRKGGTGKILDIGSGIEEEGSKKGTDSKNVTSDETRYR